MHTTPSYPKRAFLPGSPNINGVVPLSDAPLTVADWRIIHEAYIAFMTTVRRVANEAYARQDRAALDGGDVGGEG